MSSKVFKYIKWLMRILMAGGVIVLVYFLAMMIIYPEPSPDYPVGTVGGALGTDALLIYAYILLAIAIVVALIFPIINIIRNPKGAMRSLMGLGIMIVILAATYFFSSTTPVQIPDQVISNPFVLRVTDMGLYTTYIMIVAAFLAIVYGEVRGAFNKK